MAAHTHHPGDHSESHGHGNAARTYTMVLGILLVLTIITVAASRFDFGTLNVVIALVIATIKASLVALYFMHLRHEKPMNSVIFVSSLVFLAIFLFGCLEDANTRWRVEPANLKRPVVAQPGQSGAPGASGVKEQPSGTQTPGAQPPAPPKPAH